jgi:DNA-binding MarR family transcriptional regulator
MEELRYLMLAAQREGNRQLAEALRPLSLTPSQAEALRVLEDWQPLALIELGALLVCEQGSPSRLVTGLVAAGLVTRSPSPQDGRKVVLALTPQGTQRAAQVRALEAAMYQGLAELVAGRPVGEFMAVLWQFVEGRPAGDALARRLKRLPLLPEDDGPGESITTNR